MGRSVRCFLLAAAVSMAVDMMLGWVARCLAVTRERKTSKDERLLSMRTLRTLPDWRRRGGGGGR